MTNAKLRNKRLARDKEINNTFAGMGVALKQITVAIRNIDARLGVLERSGTVIVPEAAPENISRIIT